jgi:hypothetical protein
MMDRLSSGTLPIIEYGGGQAIRLYAMWTLFQHAPAFQASACQHAAFGGLSALQHFSLLAHGTRLSDGDGWVFMLAVKIREI